jgi:hypothetical protein
MHNGAYAFVERTVTELGLTPLLVLEVGSRIVNGSVRSLFHGVQAWHGLDQLPGPGVTIVGDGADYVHPTRVDLVLCCEVLEHTERAKEIVIRAGQNLRADGVFIMTCAGPERLPHSAIDGGPLHEGEWYANIYPMDFQHWLEEAGFHEVHIEGDPIAGDLYAWGRRGRRGRDG